MALYRLSVGVIRRGNTARMTARNAVAMAAYQAREPLFDERLMVEHQAPAPADLVYADILLPEHAPERWRDRATLWNEAEWREPTAQAQTARTVTLTLPRELSLSENADLARDFFARSFVSRGIVVDMAVHRLTASDGGPQPHAHALLTTRRVEADGFGLKERAWRGIAALQKWRAEWAGAANQALRAAGVRARVDHRSWAARRERVAEFASLARGVAIIGAAVTTQAMRDTARRWHRGPKERGTVPLDVSAPRAPVDVLREELRRPLRTAAVGVAAGVWSYGEAVDRLVGEHLLSAVKRYPELEPRFEDLEGKIGDALAKSIERVERQIAGNAAILRARSPGSSVTTQAMRDVARAPGREGIPMAERVAGAGLTEAEKIEVAKTRARWARIEESPRFKQMQWEVEQKIASLASGEAGSLSVDRRTTRRSTDHQTQHAHRRAHEAATARSHEHTMG